MDQSEVKGFGYPDYSPRGFNSILLLFIVLILLSGSLYNLKGKD